MESQVKVRKFQNIKVWRGKGASPISWLVFRKNFVVLLTVFCNSFILIFRIEVTGFFRFTVKKREEKSKMDFYSLVRLNKKF